MKSSVYVTVAFLSTAAVSVWASSPDSVQISSLEITASYELEPYTLQREHACPDEGVCPYPTYAGTVQIEAATDDSSGRLTSFHVSIGGESIEEFNLVERYGELGAFDLGSADISVSPGSVYLPEELSDPNVLSAITAPYIGIGAYRVFDTSCESGVRWIELSYLFDLGSHVSDGCVDDE